MSKEKEKLGFDVINGNNIFVKCEYDSYELHSQHKKKKLKDLLLRIIPSIQDKRERESIREPISYCYPFYLVDQYPLKRPIKLGYKRTVIRKHKVIGEREVISRMESGFLAQYKYLCPIFEKGNAVKRLHDIIANEMEENDLMSSCEIFWASEDGWISTSIHESKPFNELEGWSDLKKSKEREAISKEKFKVRQIKIDKEWEEKYGSKE